MDAGESSTPVGGWEKLEEIELNAVRRTGAQLSAFAGIVKDCHDCASSVPMLPATGSRRPVGYTMAALLLKRCLNDLRATWLLVKLGYTSQAATVTAALVEHANLGSCVATDREFAGRILRSRSDELPGAKQVIQHYARLTSQAQEFDATWAADYGLYKWLCKIKHPTLQAAAYDSLAATLPGLPGYALIALPDMRESNAPVKAVVIGIAVLNVLRITQSLAGSFEAQKDTPEWKSFAAKVDSVWERLGPLLRERVDDNIPHFAADDRFQTTFVRIMSDSDDRPKGGRSSNSKP